MSRSTSLRGATGSRRGTASDRPALRSKAVASPCPPVCPFDGARCGWLASARRGHSGHRVGKRRRRRDLGAAACPAGGGRARPPGRRPVRSQYGSRDDLRWRDPVPGQRQHLDDPDARCRERVSAPWSSAPQRDDGLGRRCRRPDSGNYERRRDMGDADSSRRHRGTARGPFRLGDGRLGRGDGARIVRTSEARHGRRRRHQPGRRRVSTRFDLRRTRSTVGRSVRPRPFSPPRMVVRRGSPDPDHRASTRRCGDSTSSARPQPGRSAMAARCSARPTAVRRGSSCPHPRRLPSPICGRCAQSAATARVAGDLSTLASVSIAGGTANWQPSPTLPGRDWPPPPGRTYLDGILVENDRAARYLTQLDLLGTTVPAAGTYRAYLDVWTRHLTALDRPELREVALGLPAHQPGPRPYGRCGSIPRPCRERRPALTSRPIGRPQRLRPGLRARGAPMPVTSNDCLVPAGGGYRRLENLLYRVEIQTPGPAGMATFKWSRENG